jgi:thiol-disulfide isomerase/thioredoxin
MNFYIKIVLLFVFAVLLGSCQKNNVTTILSGTIPDLKNESIKLIAVSEYFPGLDNEGLIQTKTDSVGNFSFTIHQMKPDFYQLVTLTNYSQLPYDIFLESGDSVVIKTSSWSEAPHLSISCNEVDRFDYLLEDHKIFSKNKHFYDTIRGSGFKTELLFKDFIDSLSILRIEQLKSNQSTPEPLKSHLLNVINTDRAIFLLEHLERRNFNMNGSFDYFFPDSSYYDFYDEIKFDENFCNSSAAKELSSYYLNNQTRIICRDLEEEKWREKGLQKKFEFILNQPESKWTDLLALSSIKDYPFGLLQDDFFESFIDFRNTVDEHFYLDYNRTLFSNRTEEYLRLAPGNPAPNLTLPDSSGRMRSLAEFKGRIVYIDFWGIWCYPCLREIPNLVDLQKKYAGEPVAFLFIALEHDEKSIKKWKNFIAGKNKKYEEFLNGEPFSGIHLVAEKQFYNEELKPYKLGFAPTYVLIDHKGNIVSPRAKRAKDISVEIDILLKKMRSEAN